MSEIVPAPTASSIMHESTSTGEVKHLRGLCSLRSTADREQNEGFWNQTLDDAVVGEGLKPG